jgi:hypothetical protein
MTEEKHLNENAGNTKQTVGVVIMIIINKLRMYKFPLLVSIMYPNANLFEYYSLFNRL